MSFKCGLVGKNVSNSLSPAIHKYFGSYGYSLFSVDESELLSILEKKDFDGLNVTIPYKITVMPHLDFISDEAKKIGSVNTIVNKNGALYGYNTDYFGFMKILEKIECNPKDKKVIVLGSGGASKAVTAVFRDLEAREIIVISRNGENNYGNISKHFDAAIIVNTTPVGKFPSNGEKPLETDSFKKLEAVVDINYNPICSELLVEAKERGIKTSGGLTMLVWQAKKSAEYFTDESVPDKNADKAVSDILCSMRNIVFIGMPSSGKSTIGKLFSEKTGKAFIDTDEKVVEMTGRKPSEIITENGEEYFREIETKAVIEAAKQTGKVIAVGGGAVLKKENVRFLKQNGLLVFLDRPTNELISDDRPLSVNLEEMYMKRFPIYNSVCDFRVKTEGNPLVTAEKIAQTLTQIL